MRKIKIDWLKYWWNAAKHGRFALTIGVASPRDMRGRACKMVILVAAPCVPCRSLACRKSGPLSTERTALNSRDRSGAGLQLYSAEQNRHFNSGKYSCSARPGAHEDSPRTGFVGLTEFCPTARCRRLRCRRLNVTLSADTICRPLQTTCAKCSDLEARIKTAAGATAVQGCQVGKTKN